MLILDAAVSSPGLMTWPKVIPNDKVTGDVGKSRILIDDMEFAESDNND